MICVGLQQLLTGASALCLGVAKRRIFVGCAEDRLRAALGMTRAAIPFSLAMDRKADLSEARRYPALVSPDRGAREEDGTVLASPTHLRSRVRGCGARCHRHAGEVRSLVSEIGKAHILRGSAGVGFPVSAWPIKASCDGGGARCRRPIPSSCSWQRP